jgi:transglutaminase-like putative cysteine protease
MEEVWPHALASACTGADWLDLDPTNDRHTDATSVELAHGRDYADVAPLKGVLFADAGEGVMEVAVDMIGVDRG